MTDKKSDLGSLLIQFAKANGLEWTKNDTGVAILMHGGQTLTIFNQPKIMAIRPQRGIVYTTIALLRKKITESLLGQTAGQMDGG